MAQPMTEDEVLDLFSEYLLFLGMDHALLRQVVVADRRLDGLMVDDRFVTAIEVKTNRADYRRETDAKRSQAWAVADLCMYVTPVGVVDPKTLPTGWGLAEVVAGGGIAYMAPPEPHTPERPLDAVHRMLLRRAAAVEDALRDPHTDAEEAASLRGVIARQDDALARRSEAYLRERARARDAAEQVLAFTGPQTCSACETPIEYRHVGGWGHVDRCQDEPCRVARREAERQRRERVHGVRYIASYTPPVVPLALAADDTANEALTSP